MFHSVQSVPDRVIATLRGLERACGVRKTQLIACSRARAAFGKLDRPVSTRSGHSNRGGGAGEWVIHAAPCEQERIDLPIRIRSRCWRERPVATWLLDLDSNQGLAA